MLTAQLAEVCRFQLSARHTTAAKKKTHGTSLGIIVVRRKVKQWKSEKVAKGTIATTKDMRMILSITQTPYSRATGFVSDQ